MRTPTTLLLWIWTLPLTLTACVPQAKYDEALAQSASLQLDLDVAGATRRAVEAERDELAAALADEASEREALEGIVALLRERNDTLKGELERLSEQLRAMSASNRVDRERKAALEELVAHLQDAQAETARQALEAEQRVAELQAERERLLAEKQELEEKTSAYDDLVSELQSEIESGQITISELQGKLTVQLSNAILFDSGSTAIKSWGQEALGKVAGVLATVDDRAIRVEGHTDDVPVNPGVHYRDNWGLSALRASAVVGLLVDNGVDPANIAAVGYADTRPVATNETDEGRAANRRTEIVLVPRLQESGEVAPDAVDDPPAEGSP